MKNYKDYKYFENRPDVVKVFNDLDKLLDFCRFEMLPYDPADLYNRQSKVWQAYERSTKPRKPWNGDRKPYQGKRHNGERFSH